MKPGDVVRSKATGNFYTVVKLVDKYWFVHNQSDKPKLVDNFVVVSQNWNDIQKTCNHRWVDVGFRFSRVVCFNCNIEKDTV